MEVPSGDELTFEKLSPLQLVERVAPARLAPVMVTVGAVPCMVLDGLSPVTDGAALLVIAKLKLVEPPLAVSVTDALPTHALDEILNVAEMPFPSNSGSCTMLLKLRPGHVVDSETPQRFVPLI